MREVKKILQDEMDYNLCKLLLCEHYNEYGTEI